MTPEQQRSILAIALFAAFADGAKDDREREEVRRIAESLTSESGEIDLARLYQDVLLKRLSLAAATAALTDEGQRQFAYEMAVCVCEADGRMAPAERRFLDELRQALVLDGDRTEAIEGEINPMVDIGKLAAPPANRPEAHAPSQVQPPVAIPASAELDKSILNYALLNGALELLPQSWASMAIIPLQIKMVYGIGKSHGVELDQAICVLHHISVHGLNIRANAGKKRGGGI